MKLCTLLYHDVIDGEEIDASGFPGAGPGSYKLDINAFRDHLSAIAAAIDDDPITINDLQNVTFQNRLMLTFDDGGVSAYNIIANCLQEYGWTAHIFVTTDYIDTPGFLSRKQIIELHAAGHIIGSHSCSHPPRMAALETAELEKEWRKSINMLTEITGELVTSASIPGGYYSNKVVAAATRAGIKYLFTSEPHARSRKVAGCTTIGRFTVRREVDSATAASAATGNTHTWFKQSLFWNSKKLLKIVFGKYYLNIRRRFFAGKH